jgi:hypothetical protein
LIQIIAVQQSRSTLQALICEVACMNILIRPLTMTQGNRWQVRMDQHAVSFRTEAEAHSFVATLEARLRAPHFLPCREQRAAS